MNSLQVSNVFVGCVSYCLLYLKFRCHRNQGQSWQNLSDVIQYIPTHKTPQCAQASQRYFIYKLSYSLSCHKFRCHGNQGRSLKILLISFDSLTQKTPC